MGSAEGKSKGEWIRGTGLSVAEEMGLGRVAGEGARGRTVESGRGRGRTGAAEWWPFSRSEANE